MPGAIVKSKLTPTYGYNVVAGRYVGARGRFVKAADVRKALDTALQRSQDEIRFLSRDLQNGRISIAEWQTAVGKEIRDAHRASAALAKGGWAQMTSEDNAAVGKTVKGELGYLANFGKQIADGEQNLDGAGFLSRADMYAQGPRGTYHEVYRGVMQDAGMDECRSILGAGENSCDECIEEADKGWIPIEDAVEIGSRTCLANCRCDMLYRNSRDGGDE